MRFNVRAYNSKVEQDISIMTLKKYAQRRLFCINSFAVGSVRHSFGYDCLNGSVET